MYGRMQRRRGVSWASRTCFSKAVHHWMLFWLTNWAVDWLKYPRGRTVWRGPLTGQRLHHVFGAFRIGDPKGEFPIFDATGSALSPGRWNTASHKLIYAAEHYSTAMLEKLARFLGELPPNQRFIEITLPNGLSYEVVSTAHLAGWDDPLAVASKAWGDQWCRECRSAIAFVPSVVARIERNVLINPAHAEFPQITYSLHQPVWWDARLFCLNPAVAGIPPRAVPPDAQPRPGPSHDRWR